MTAPASAIVKVHDSYSSALLESFFVGKNQTATVMNIPDGTCVSIFNGTLAVAVDQVTADNRSQRGVGRWS
jgi:hypothetical protein